MSSLVYKNRIAGTLHSVRRVTSSNYLIEINGVWSDIKAYKLRDKYKLHDKKTNREFTRDWRRDERNGRIGLLEGRADSPGAAG